MITKRIGKFIVDAKTLNASQRQYWNALPFERFRAYGDAQTTYRVGSILITVVNVPKLVDAAGRGLVPTAAVVSR